MLIVCNTCNIPKESNEFPKCKKGRGFQGVCKKCKAKWMRDDRINNPDKYREMDLMQNYGITLKEYNALLEKQKGVCAICSNPETAKKGNLHVDHCHKTRKVRGLLCWNCNTGLGKFYEDVAILEKALAYIKEVV